MKVKDIMSKNLVMCDPDDNILFVSNLMNVWDVGFVLIMKNGKLYGVVTDRDLVCDMANQLSHIKSYASQKVITIDKNKDVLEALKLMKKHRIKRLVITDSEKVVGVLSLSDIFETDISSEIILDALKSIYKINRNTNKFDTDVSDFPL
ncbi:MAG: CBS domain-containing protein [Bacilli bacterium]|nr:CBS domain-containing protein [Bacilli bacterium]